MLQPPSRPSLHRRQWLARAALLSPWALLAACASPWPPVPPGAGSSSARQRLRESADAHGAAAWRGLHDVNLAVDQLWAPAGGLTGPAQLRWRPADGVMALQATEHADRAAERPTAWRRYGEPGAQRCWRGGEPVTDPALAAAVARQADLLRLLWLGPVAVADGTGAVNWAEPETLDGRRCDHLHLALVPGLGGTPGDRLSLFIDRDEGWLRRLRVSMAGTAGGTSPLDVLQIDLAGQQRLHGVVWPTRCQPGTLQRFAAPAPPWRLTGLDVNRGYPAEAIAGADWHAPARATAAPLPPG